MLGSRHEELSEELGLILGVWRGHLGGCDDIIGDKEVPRLRVCFSGWRQKEEMNRAAEPRGLEPAAIPCG